jgi:hypothetical protein
MLDDGLKWLIDELCRLFENCSSRMMACLFISDEMEADTFPEEMFLVLEENNCWTFVDC